MIRRSIVATPDFSMRLINVKRCTCMAYAVMIQCLLVFAGSATILRCMWRPEKFDNDVYKLFSIMYLFDKTSCRYRLKGFRERSILILSNDTRGLDLVPIQWAPAISTVTSKFSSKTRMYVEVSVAFHVLWMLSALAFRLSITYMKHSRWTTRLVNCFFYSCIFMLFFDVSMAIVYIAYIKYCLTRGMILRYCGWNIKLVHSNPNDFGGWFPMTAAICWLRGIVFFIFNVYTVNYIYHLRKKIRHKTIIKNFEFQNKLPIPEARYDAKPDAQVLLFRPGERKPADR